MELARVTKDGGVFWAFHFTRVGQFLLEAHSERRLDRKQLAIHGQWVIEVIAAAKIVPLPHNEQHLLSWYDRCTILPNWHTTVKDPRDKEWIVPDDKLKVLMDLCRIGPRTTATLVPVHTGLLVSKLCNLWCDENPTRVGYMDYASLGIQVKFKECE